MVEMLSDERMALPDYKADTSHDYLHLTDKGEGLKLRLKPAIMSAFGRLTPL